MSAIASPMFARSNDIARANLYFDTEKSSAFDKVNQSLRRMGYDTQYLIAPKETEFIKPTIIKALRYSPSIDLIASTDNIGPGMLKYTYYTYNKLQGPELSQDFEHRSNVYQSSTEATVELHGLQYDWHFPKTWIDASTNPNALYHLQPGLMEGQMRELAIELALYRNKYLYRGTDCAGMTDVGITGLLNAPGTTTAPSVGLDNDDSVITTGDGPDLASKMAGVLIAEKFEPPFILHLSPGLLRQFDKNRTTTEHTSDLQIMYEMKGENGENMFEMIRSNPFMLDTETEVNATGSCAIYKRGYDNFRIGESYALNYYPLPPTSLGVDGKMLWMGQMIVPRPKSISFKSGITTNVWGA
jgi:hypothetical protein